MLVCIAAFTLRGLKLARRLAVALSRGGDKVEVACPARIADKADSTDVCAMADLTTWTADAFARADALLFVGACGIAVRAVAPYVRDKFCDPAVVCVDEAGTYAIPLLSGHVGGANDLARRVSAQCGAQAVLTTATDVNGTFAVDEWARMHSLAIVERERAKEVSAALLEGRSVGFVCDAGFATRSLFDGELPHGLVDGAEAESCELGIAITLDAAARPFACTLHLVPRVITVGVGCKRGTSADAILQAVDACMEQVRVAPQAVRTLASIDVKKGEEGLRAAAKARGWELRFHSAEELAAVPGDFSSSEFVLQTVGVDNVCERAACACGEELLLGRVAKDGVTVAIAVAAKADCPQSAKGDAQTASLVTCVGLGPGGADGMTLQAHKALQCAEVIVGYTTYVDLVRDAYPQAEFVTTPMRKEVERCRLALERAVAGQRVAMVCSGDPGVYGMAGLLYELAPEYPGVSVEVVPGVTAANGGAAVLGAPLMHDWCCISLSDLMTPWITIEKRLKAAARADLCVCLYNPGSHGRTDHLRRACDVLLEHRDASTVCGIAHKIGRFGESSEVLSLADLRDAHVDMLTCVFVGNSQTRAIDGRMVTPRGYSLGQREVPPLPRGGQEECPPACKDTSRAQVLVFGGTAEGRQLVEWLDARNTCDVVACTATGYGASLIAGSGHVTVVQGPLSGVRKRELMQGHDFACIVDATHPYAQHISASIDELARAYGKDVVRIEREAPLAPGDASIDTGPWVSVSSVAEAARHVAKTTGNVLLTTGSKDLQEFVQAMPDYTQRLYVRVLPVRASIDRVLELGVPAAHVIAMQGPFSAELNAALIHSLDIASMVTKQSGPTGGFDQKVQAAQACGIELVVVERPPSLGGVSLRTAKSLLEKRYGL